MVPVKVNAWVDSGIAGLVEALNLHPAVVTVDSCEGDERRSPYVLFTCRGDLDELTRELARLLGPELVASWKAYLRVEHFHGSQVPLAELVVAEPWVAHVAEVLRSRLRFSERVPVPVPA